MAVSDKSLHRADIEKDESIRFGQKLSCPTKNAALTWLRVQSNMEKQI